ncbi:hypothetical protein JKP88DRAFT_352774 [Tribonema minus]|uniref:Uncharacterized protein n=1 Tax=Tribonema minus TaxID=303371 RepID=A0A835ZD71_9STRA|nr:hypothetical protein JKP88DRAFT_352774 [Tribonema minus]
MKGEGLKRRFTKRDGSNLIEAVGLDADTLGEEVLGHWVRQAEDKFESLCFEKGVQRKLAALDASADAAAAAAPAPQLTAALRPQQQQLAQTQSSNGEMLPLPGVSAREAVRAAIMEVKLTERQRLAQQGFHACVPPLRRSPAALTTATAAAHAETSKWRRSAAFSTARSGQFVAAAEAQAQAEVVACSALLDGAQRRLEDVAGVAADLQAANEAAAAAEQQQQR